MEERYFYFSGKETEMNNSMSDVLVEGGGQSLKGERVMEVRVMELYDRGGNNVRGKVMVGVIEYQWSLPFLCEVQ